MRFKLFWGDVKERHESLFIAERQKWWHGAGAARRRREGSMKRPHDSEKKRLAPLLTHVLFGLFISVLFQANV